MSEYAAGWYPDPTRRHQHRYWDGRGWTEHVGSDGVASTDPVAAGSPATADAVQEDGPARPDAAGEGDRLERAQVQEILAEAGVRPGRTGGGSLFDEPVLVHYQRVTDLSEGLRYSIVSPAGTVVGRCHEILDSLDPDEASWGELYEEANADRMALIDPSGAPWARLAHKKSWKSKITMTDPAGREIGVVQQQNVMGKVRLGIETAGHDLGQIVSDNTQMLGFTINDAAKNPVGRIVKLGRYAQPGPFGPQKSLGCYVLRLDSRPTQPMHSLLVAAPVAIDLAFAMTQAGQRALARKVTGH